MAAACAPRRFLAPSLRRSAGDEGGHLALAYQGTFDNLNPYNLSAGSTAQGLIGNVFQSLMLRSLDEPLTSMA